MPEQSPSEARRLHPAAIPVWAAESLKRLGLGLIGILAVQGPERLFLIAFAVIAVVVPAVRYLLFSYRISGETIVVEGGLVPRWRRVIPLARIQSVDRIQKLRHRLFGVVELRIEAAGGHGTEADLVALSPSEAERIRAALLDRGAPASAAAQPDAPLIRLEPRELFLAGITGGRVAVLAAMLAWLQEALPDGLQQQVIDRIGATGAASLLLVVVAVAAFLFVSLIVSVAATILVYWDFTIARQDGRLVIERGLLDKRRSTVPLTRVQAVVLNENLIRRALGLASLSVVVAGYAGPREEQEETSTLLPIARRGRALSLAVEVVGAPHDLVMGALDPAPRRAMSRWIIRGSIYGLIAGGAALGVVGPLGAAAFALCIPGALLGIAAWRNLGHRIEGGYAVLRSGWWVRKTSVVPLGNVQELKLTRGPLQRLYRLASVRLRIPKAEPAAIDLDDHVAHTRFAAVGAELIGTPWGAQTPR